MLARKAIVLFWGFAIGLAACSDDASTAAESDPLATDANSAPSDSGGSTGDPGGAGGEASVAMVLTSTAFAEGETIPRAHECGGDALPPFDEGPGDNLTPPLSWTPGPPGTQSYAVVMRDLDFRPDNYDAGLVHWVIYDIPASVTSLPEGIADAAMVNDPAGARQPNMQRSGFFGYFGPCSARSVNTYQFTVHAMAEANLDFDLMTTDFAAADGIEAASLASASLSGES